MYPGRAALWVLAREASREGTPLIVIGEGEHPEVQGILGWTEAPAWAVLTEEDVKALPPLQSARVVAQTTMVEERFRALCPSAPPPATDSGRCWKSPAGPM